MTKILKIISIVIVVIVVCISVPPLAEHYGDAHPLALSFTEGEPYSEIIKKIPRRFIFRDLHKYDETDMGYTEREAEKLGIDPEYVMHVNNCFFPFTVPYGWVLFFDENKCFMGFGCSGL